MTSKHSYCTQADLDHHHAVHRVETTFERRVVFTLVTTEEYAIGSVCLAKSIALVHPPGTVQLIVLCTDELIETAIASFGLPTSLLDTVVVPSWECHPDCDPYVKVHATCFAKFRLWTATAAPLGHTLSDGERRLREITMTPSTHNAVPCSGSFVFIDADAIVLKPLDALFAAVRVRVSIRTGRELQ